MGKFKVGDHVIILAFGRRGIIVKAEGFALPNYYVHCIETDSGDWYDESELKLANNEKKGEKKRGQKRFKSGDMIVMNELADTKYHYCITKMGWVGRYCNKNEVGFIIVEDVKSLMRYTVAEDAVGPYVRPKRRIVIEITDDGAKAKYIFGKEIDKTASIKRHPNDKPDDEMAAMFVMQKLFGYNLRNIEKAADEKIRLNEEAIRWICDAKEALDEAEKRTRKLLN